MKKALKTFTLTVVGGAATILIPLVHWVTVPASLLLAPVLAAVVYKTNLHRASIVCPDAQCLACQQPMPLTFASDVTELERTCKHCGKTTKISLQL